MVPAAKTYLRCVSLVVIVSVILLAEEDSGVEAISFRTGWNGSTYKRRENQMVNRQRALNKGMYPHLVPNKFMTRAEEHDQGWKQFTAPKKQTRKPKGRDKTTVTVTPSSNGSSAAPTSESVTPAPRGKWPGYKCCATQRIELASGFGAAAPN